MLKIGMASFWHVHAKDYAAQVEKHPDTQIAAIWDENPERGRAEAEARGVPFYDSYDEMLAQVDAIVLDAPTTMHRELMVAAAEAGKHIFTEKVIAATLKECNEIIEACRKNGIRLVTSLPRLNFGYTLELRKLVEQKLLGSITLVRARLSHGGGIPNETSRTGWLPEHFYNKEETGGGAMIDLGCHPMYLVRLLLGMPECVQSSYGCMTGRQVEDNAVAILRCPNGAMGIVEAGFVNHFSPFALEVHGTEGSALYTGHDGKLLVRSTLMGDEYKNGWTQHPIPDDAPTAFEQWVGHIQNETAAVENLQLAVDLTKLMEASNLSAAEGRPVLLKELQD
ncbi:dehydrogenase [Paenibacillus sp. J31TS4]|uniref:Gfo/Idh/MocA family protein n=1 Tax=Paenibacillus sp. J31TS4 TaxID=2807195 RepID=UPI001B24DA45|nr:Gfo/Idh/MocA family oxidoreductase [Paenibacillus sp. J31TS4]GIP38130.1 dehydrogenase [Paenibacillus sp. J31TS4]